MADCLTKLDRLSDHQINFSVTPPVPTSPDEWSEFFDSRISTEDATDDRSEIYFDYRCLTTYMASSQQPDKAHKKFRTSDSDTFVLSEMEALADFVKNHDLQPLLKHPLLSSFLYLKWHRIRNILYAQFFFYCIYYALIFSYILSTNHNNDLSPLSPPKSSNLTSAIPHTNSEQLYRTLTALFLVFLITLEAFQLQYSPKHYLFRFENIIKIGLIIVSCQMLVAPCIQIRVVVLLLITLELVILMSQHPRMSTVIEMFQIVAINFLRFALLSAILIVTFTLVFFTLFSSTKDNKQFHDLGQSLFATILMLTGEFNAMGISFASYPVFGPCIFVLFIFIIFIVMCNLLNDLAFSNINDISNKSEIAALISRVKLISFFERMAVGSEQVIFAGQWFTQTVVHRLMRNPSGFLTRETHPSLTYLFSHKISVQPYNSNKIIIYETNGERKVTDWSMDPLIVHGAKKVLSCRKSQEKEKAAEKEYNMRIFAEFDKINVKLKKLDTINRVSVQLIEQLIGSRRRSI